MEYPFEDRGAISGANLQPEVNAEEEEEEEKVNHKEKRVLKATFILN